MINGELNVNDVHSLTYITPCIPIPPVGLDIVDANDV